MGWADHDRAIVASRLVLEGITIVLLCIHGEFWLRPFSFCASGVSARDCGFGAKGVETRVSRDLASERLFGAVVIRPCCLLHPVVAWCVLVFDLQVSRRRPRPACTGTERRSVCGDKDAAAIAESLGIFAA